ncbi:MAG: hypothetical protein ABIR17_02220 [Pseudolysinimonas sp.]|uniref:SCO7613 C-terminal domain-containing membrane protein n=1 Tax=Pseudolysinimonas sp. TaxID=2680009 RepID=UPI003266E876
MPWSDQAARYLLGSTTCPRCERGPVNSEYCPYCGAILVGPIADELRDVSAQAASLLQRRQEIVGRLTTKAALAPPPVGAPSAVGSPAPVGAPPVVGVPAQRTATVSSQISLQSVLAIAGAALFAVAVIVFRFFSQDVDLSARRIVLGIVTLLFLGFAWLLARLTLRFSAEAVGALAMVFVALDVWAISELAPGDLSPWTLAAISTLVASVFTLLIALLVRLRTWLWLGLVGLVLVPAFFGYATEGPWSTIVGHLGAAAVALVGYEFARRFAARFASPLLADRVTMVVLAAGFAAVALLTLPSIAVHGRVERDVGTAVVFAVTALLAAAATRTLAAKAWSAAVGVLGVAAVGILPFALDLHDDVWMLALVPAAAAVALTALVVTPWPGTVRRAALRIGGLAVMLAAAVPATVIAGAQLLSPLTRDRYGSSTAGDPSWWLVPMARSSSLIPGVMSLAAILGLGVAAAGVLAVAVAARRGSSGPGRAFLILSAWLAGATLAAAPGWSSLSRPGQIVLGIVLAAGISLALVVVPRVRTAALALRIPLLAAAHVILLYLVAISWVDDRVVVAAGVLIVASFALLALAMPAAARPAYVVVGYGFALIIVARGLDLLGLDAIPVLSYTATAASLFALAVTLIRRVRARLWYAVLGVTAVPFLIGVATVIAERTWETALANAAIFALALTLTLTRRPGLNIVLRSAAAALMLPSLAVAVVNLVPRIIETNIVPAWNGGGGAPVTLPIIATLVALVLPITPLVGDSLRRGEIPDDQSRSVQRWIEISAFVTGAIAALLSLVLQTPDLGTSLTVFVILGIGAAAAAVFAKRRFGWWAAAASWTAALWCVWGLVGIADIEPYVYPPALGAALVGLMLTLRGRSGGALVGPGLAIALATSLVVLAVSGSGPDAVLPWRALALLTASLVLLVIGVVLDRGTGRWRLSVLRIPVLAAGIGAAAAGAVQGARYGVGADHLATTDSQSVMLTVLAYAIAATLLAAAAGFSLRLRSATGPSRWVLLPALVFLGLGPITAVAPGAPMWTLWGLMLALLALMIVSVVRALAGPTTLPPVWATFAVAWAVAVAGWSTRELNVEWFSLPLGFALTAAGVLALTRGVGATGGTAISWPVGFTRSWVAISPGLVVTVLPSVLATGTNPATWRAILVIALALVMLLGGSFFRYAAPFILSLVTFGIEIIVVLVRLGTAIDAVVLYVALGTAATVLLVIAIGFERRTGGDKTRGPRMRDLR